jgi:nucleoside-diphosphate-sugar epimerase
VEVVEGDISKRGVWEQVLEGAQFVFHLAAQTSSSVANSDPVTDLTLNVLPMIHLLETCRTRGYRPIVVFSGAATQAGLTPDLPVDEQVPDQPLTVYDLHKLASEHYLECYTRLGHVRGTTLRLANVYGPGPVSSSADRGILNAMIRKALRGEALTVYGTGDRIRDYVFVKDVGQALLAAAVHIDRTEGEHFVIGSGRGHTIAEAANLVADCVALRTGRRVPIQHMDPPAGLSPIEGRHFVANCTRFTARTNWQATVSLSEGIDRTIDALLQEKS